MTYHLVYHRLDTMVGHRFAEATGLVRELERRNAPVRLYLHERADRDVRDAFPGARAVLSDPVFANLPFDRRTEMFVEMLRRHVEPAITQDDRVIVTIATQCESRAFAKWMAGLPAGHKPWVVVYMISDRWNHGSAQERVRQSAEWSVHGSELRAARPEDRGRLIFAAATGALAGEIAEQLGSPVTVISTPMPRELGEPADAPRRPSAQGPLRIGLLGGARPEKGSALIPAIIERVRAEAPVEFVVQIKNEKLPPAEFRALEAFAGAPGVRAFSDPRAYEQMRDDTDILLLPYRQTPYARRTSGIFLEGVLTGRPVVVPEGTWMAEHVESGRAAGVTFRQWTPEDIAAAVVACVRDYLPLRKRAEALAGAWREQEGVSAFVNRIEQEIASRS